MTPILRYFDCRGRAQPLRFFLAHHNVAFVDERVPFTDDWQTWAAMKSDPVLSGPFAQLPVLEWEEEHFTQTNLIASFLQQAVAPGDDLRMICETQSVLSENLGQLYVLFNLDLFAPGADVKEFGDRAFLGMDSAFAGYEALLAAGRQPFGEDSSLSIAAFWLLELWQFVGALYAQQNAMLLEGRPMLNSLIQTLEQASQRLSADNAPPAWWSARPDEPVRLPAVQQALAAH